MWYFADKQKTLNRRPVYTIELGPTEPTVSESSLKPMTPRRVKRRSGSRGDRSSVRRSRRSYRNAGYLASTASLPRDQRARPTSAHSSYSNFHAARPNSYHAPEREGLSRSQTALDPPPPPPAESIPIVTSSYDYDSASRNNFNPGYDVVGYGGAKRGYEPKRYDLNMTNYDNRHGYEETGRSGYESRMETISPCDSPPYSGYGGYIEGWEAPPPPAPPYSARATPQAPGPPAYQPATELYNMVP